MEELPLRDIHLPEPVGWWPPAIGWWLLLLLMLALAGVLTVWVRNRRRETPIKRALRQLADIEKADLESRERLQMLSGLMKRVALSLEARETVAGLAGQNWLAWLAEHTGDDRFNLALGRLLAEAPYRSQPDPAALGELLTLCREGLIALGTPKQRIILEKAVGQESTGSTG